MHKPTIDLRPWGEHRANPAFSVYRGRGRAAQSIGVICWQEQRGYWRIVAHEPGKPLATLASWTMRGELARRDQARDQLLEFHEQREEASRSA